MKTYSNSHPFKGLSFLWAVPRSSSTAFLRGMQNNSQLATFHEPYTDTYYFSCERKTNRHFDNAVISEVDVLTGAKVNQQLMESATQSGVFVKELAFQGEPYVDNELMKLSGHALLVRHPWSVYASIIKLKPDFTEEEFGFTAIERVFKRLLALDLPFKIIDSDRFRVFPQQVYRETCQHLGYEFNEDMLSWDCGKVRPWQEHEKQCQQKWHIELERSKGIMPSTPLRRIKSIEANHDLIVQKAESVYRRLVRHQTAEL